MLKTISVAQMDIRLNDPAANMERAQTWAAERPAAAGMSYCCRNSGLPASISRLSWTYPGCEKRRLAGNQGHRPPESALADWLDLFRRPDGAVCNRALAVSPAGEIAAAYDKIHLFKKMREDAFLAAGREAVSFEAPWGKAAWLSASISAFRSFSGVMRWMGRSFYSCRSEFPQPRLAHWQALCRARAIENQLFIIAANRVGQDNAGRYFGHSAIIDHGESRCWKPARARRC